MRPILQLAAAGLLFSCVGVVAAAQASPSFTLRQAMSAPFTSDLTAAPVGDAFAWVSNAEGKRNIWVAMLSRDVALVRSEGDVWAVLDIHHRAKFERISTNVRALRSESL